MSGHRIHLIVPGSIRRRTGGSIYDARMAAELRTAGRVVLVYEAHDPVRVLHGPVPEGDDDAGSTAARALEASGPADVMVVDGLALAELDGLSVGPIAPRLIVICHMPADREGGRAAAARAALARAEAAWLPRAARIVVTSAHVQQILVHRGVALDAIAVVEPGTDPVPPRLPRGDAAGGVRLLCVGAVTHVKGHRFLIRALARLAHLRWTLRLAGDTMADPEAHRALAAEIDALGLAGRVRLTGELTHDEIQSAYRAADAFVLPSLFESYGMALAEALAHGLPLVATRAGALPETPAGQAAMLVPPGDVGALARALAGVIRSRRARAELAAISRTAAHRLTTWHAAARRFADVVDSAAVGEAPTRESPRP